MTIGRLTHHCNLKSGIGDSNPGRLVGSQESCRWTNPARSTFTIDRAEGEGVEPSRLIARLISNLLHVFNRLTAHNRIDTRRNAQVRGIQKRFCPGIMLLARRIAPPDAARRRERPPQTATVCATDPDFEVVKEAWPWLTPADRQRIASLAKEACLGLSRSITIGRMGRPES